MKILISILIFMVIGIYLYYKYFYTIKWMKMKKEREEKFSHFKFVNFYYSVSNEQIMLMGYEDGLEPFEMSVTFLGLEKFLPNPSVIVEKIPLLYQGLQKTDIYDETIKPIVELEPSFRDSYHLKVVDADKDCFSLFSKDLGYITIQKDEKTKNIVEKDVLIVSFHLMKDKVVQYAATLDYDIKEILNSKY